MLTGAVSEPIALEIKDSSNTYLYCIIYTGIMYLIAGAFAWLLRAWKIDQLEVLAAEQGVSATEADHVQAVTLDRVISKELRAQRSGTSRRLFRWQRV